MLAALSAPHALAGAQVEEALSSSVQAAPWCTAARFWNLLSHALSLLRLGYGHSRRCQYDWCDHQRTSHQAADYGHISSGLSALSAAAIKTRASLRARWDEIGESGHNLFNLRTNLRYGCTILRHYLDLENGDYYRALGRYNGSLGRAEYPNAVLANWQQNWAWSYAAPVAGNPPVQTVTTR